MAGLVGLRRAKNTAGAQAGSIRNDLSAVIPGRAHERVYARFGREPGIQMHTLNLLLDSGFARSASAPE